MSGPSFGTWGIRVSRDEFSCALAALGIIGERSAGLRSPKDVATVLADVRVAGVLDWFPWFIPRLGNLEIAAGALPAEVLAEGWNQFVATANSPIRIQVVPYPIIDPLWILGELSRPVVKATSVYLWKRRLSDKTRWHWPLRVGFLCDDRSKKIIKAITAQIKRKKWENLLRVFDITGAERCDLLVSTLSARSTLALVAQRDSPPQADCAIVFDAIGSAPERTFRTLNSIDAELRTNAIAMARPSIGSEVVWFTDFIRLLSHDDPVDVALTSSLGGIESRNTPLIMADGDWLQEVRLSRMTRNLLMATSGGKAGESENREIARHAGHVKALFEIERDPEFFFKESGGATTLAKATLAIGPALRRQAASQLRDHTRYLQAKVFQLDGEGMDAPSTNVTRFRDSVPHRVDVRIGPEEAKWISNKEVFPENLPRREIGHQLTVVFTEPVMTTQPQVGHIFLPRFGPSSTCSFYLVPQGNHRTVHARVSVLYKNRVLQTSVLEGTVTKKGAEQVANSTISFHPEVIVSPGMSDLDQQGSFGAALILNHTANGGAQVTKIVNDSAELISVSNLSQWVDKIEDRLGRSDWGAKDMQRLDTAGTLDLLRYLAAHGSLLYNGIVKQQFVDQTLTAAKRVQLIAARSGTRLPVEYFYEMSSPRADAKLCPSAKAALLKGKCPVACAGRKDQRSYVCPLGFWGLNRVLEWHLYRPAAAKELGNHDFALQQDKIASRKQLDVMRQALVGASTRADAEVKNSVAKLEQNIKKSGVPLQPANTWTKWEDSVRKYGPSMLVLIPHTDNDSRDIQQLEIGKAQWLPLDQLDERYVGNDKVHPVVFLLGCETAKQEASFEDFISNFASHGAAIVVASSTLVLGRQATVVAAEFVSTLKRMSKSKDKTFGDVVLSVRRTMLSKGYPMIMSVSAYGDADWRI